MKHLFHSSALQHNRPHPTSSHACCCDHMRPRALPLNHRWAEYKTDEGKPYYYNEASATTQWTYPEE